MGRYVCEQNTRLAATLRRIQWRLLPFLGLLYFVSFLDRVNISFAKLTMNSDLGFDDSTYALGAGIFFLGYFLFEVPSNLVLTRIGARLWIARIMITWGLLSAGTAFVTGPTSFLVLRFALGAAEAGFFPGILLYLTYWFPASDRARVMGMFVAAIPICGLVGSPLSSELLALDGWLGLHGWQWMLMLEGLPAVVLGLSCLKFLPNGPHEVKWLGRDEVDELSAALVRERAAVEQLGHSSIRAAFTHPLVWVLSLVYFGIILGLYGFGFWLPTLVRDFGVELTRIGWVAAIPFGAGAIFTMWWSYRSDVKRERILHFIVAALLGFVGFAAASEAESNALQLLCLSIAAMGIYSAMSIFWTLPSLYLSGVAVATGFALINSFGNLAGYFGPQLVAWLAVGSGDFDSALLSLSISMLMSAAIIISTRKYLLAPTGQLTR